MSQAEILSASHLVLEVKNKVAGQIKLWSGEKNMQPVLAVVMVSQDPASRNYLQAQQRIAIGLGARLELVELEETIGQAPLNQVLTALSEDQSVHGILLQLPLPAHLDIDAAVSCISPLKDVDGMTVANLRLLKENHEGRALIAATAQACLMLAESYTPLTGKKVAVVGRGRTVGGPLIQMLQNRGIEAMVCHRQTADLAVALRSSQVVFVAVGKPGLLTPSQVQPGQIIIDAGITVIDDRVVGDVDPAVAAIVTALSPVPGGVGSLTSVIIFQNLLKALYLQGIR